MKKSGRYAKPCYAKGGSVQKFASGGSVGRQVPKGVTPGPQYDLRPKPEKSKVKPKSI